MGGIYTRAARVAVVLATPLSFSQRDADELGSFFGRFERAFEGDMPGSEEEQAYFCGGEGSRMVRRAAGLLRSQCASEWNQRVWTVQEYANTHWRLEMW